ncbi:MAG TPA: 3',5'-cyclic-AMP phosphodiesterase [Gammaproteobacteria bacterium]|nr:3',5'-cyclic-AMP phosphodiesterase [Gammaproteobacteria bacterium]
MVKAYPKPAADGTLHLVQITDTHLFAESGRCMHHVDTRESFERVIAAIAADEQPDLLVATGDLAQDETFEAYREFASVLAPLDVPALALCGNHDNPDRMAAAFAGSAITLAKQTDVGAWRIVQLHTQVPGETFGRLDDAELALLDAALDTDRPALICLHHPPLAVGSPWLDEIGLTNTDAFFDIIDRHPAVRGVVAGHVHQEMRARRGAVDYFTTPSTSVQFQPGVTKPAFDAAPPGYRRLHLHPDGTIESSVVRLEHA